MVEPGKKATRRFVSFEHAGNSQYFVWSATMGLTLILPAGIPVDLRPLFTISSQTNTCNLPSSRWREEVSVRLS